MKKVVFYHAGCPVCVEAEQTVVDAIDRRSYTVEVVHLGNNKARIREAERGRQERAGVVLDGVALHINYGAGLEDVKG